MSSATETGPILGLLASSTSSTHTSPRLDASNIDVELGHVPTDDNQQTISFVRNALKVRPLDPETIKKINSLNLKRDRPGIISMIHRIEIKNGTLEVKPLIIGNEVPRSTTTQVVAKDIIKLRPFDADYEDLGPYEIERTVLWMSSDNEEANRIAELSIHNITSQNLTVEASLNPVARKKIAKWTACGIAAVACVVIAAVAVVGIVGLITDNQKKDPYS